MELYEYIALLSMVVWVVIPFFHVKSRHVYFFLFIGLNDLISATLWFGFGISSQLFWIPILYLAVTCIEKQFFIKNMWWIVFGFIAVFILNFYSTTQIQYVFSLFTSIIIFIIFARHFYWEFIKGNTISLFYTVLTLFSLFSISQSILLVGNINLGLSAYFVSMIIKIMLGIFLILARKDYKFSL